MTEKNGRRKAIAGMIRIKQFNDGGLTYQNIAIILIAVVVLSVACAGYYFMTTEEKLPGEVEYKTYVNENYSFKFDYPVD